MTSRTRFHDGNVGDNYYAKPYGVILPWESNVISGVPNPDDAREYSFPGILDDISYRIFLRKNASPEITDEFIGTFDSIRFDLIDSPNSAAVTEIQDGLATSSVLSSVVGNVNDILTDTSTTIPNLLPANFELLLVNSSGHIERVTLVDTTTDLTNDVGGGLDAAGLRSAIGMASANLDTQLDGIANDTGTDLPNAISSLSVQVNVVDSNVDTIVTSTGVTIPSQINNLNDLSAADIDARLTAYDAPTKNEIDVAQASIEAACATLTTSQLRAAISGRWTDEDGNTFDLVVTDTP